MKSGFTNWSDVRVFLAVLRSGSTLAAAKSLGLSQPTIARRIDALEHELKLTLFHRDTRGFHPTTEADALREAAEAMEQASETFQNVAQAARSAPQKPIRMTAPPQNFSTGLTRILEDFRAENPETQFEFVSSYKVLDLAAGEADVAIRITDDLSDDRLICRRLSTATGSLYAARSYAERHGLPASPQDLSGHKYLVMENAPRSMNINAWLQEHCAPEQIVSRCSDIEALITSAMAGIGVAPLPTTIAAEHPDLVRCFAPPEGCSVSVWLMISPRAWARPEVKAFAAFFAPRWSAYIKAYKLSLGIEGD